ncbi:hypothetical protein [Chryseobacterium sp. EO14]|uniref:DUF7222 domain-containing protein n=1 Tax=Chryseobacterium sp. EO14 TaxID=2950551 RepID=UPI00210C068D|nr:hypothetical protein [Chryseobacterium sp. EO14]MCQ4142514.1 hypothetical protein [Chryseobacterium sp. EO14]
MNTKTIIKKLKAIANEPADSIRKEVAKECLKSHEVRYFFQKLCYEGSQSGMIDHLGTSPQAHLFFDRYQEEINALTMESKENISTPLIITGDIKTSLAYFAFDEIGYRLSQELRLEL